jgi:hypothetical protein
MAPQLQINQGPQDALLFDNTKSFFTNVPYTRTSNFQMELRDVDPQNTANLGATVNFVIPKAADLLGPTDLMIEFDKPTFGSGTATGPGGSAAANHYYGWVESVGLAMIEKITFSVGSHDIETLTGDHLNIMNELMRSDTSRYGYKMIGKTGRPLVQGVASTAASTIYRDVDTSADVHDRLIAFEDTTKDGKKLIVPLGLFYTTHPSKYFPLAACAGCNDVRISIKFRTLNELLQVHVAQPAASNVLTGAAPSAVSEAIRFGNSVLKRCQLRCHYIHVTGPEATALMNREHVRLMKLWDGNHVPKQFKIACSSSGTESTLDIDLSFLHPVTELVMTIRKVSDMGSSVDPTIAIGTGDKAGANTAATKNYFAYHGGGSDPNMDSWHNAYSETGTSTVPKPTHLKVKTFQLKLNGQSRHLDGQGVDRDYLMERMMPMLHSNADEFYARVSGAIDGPVTGQDLPALKMLSQLKDRKEIYVYPFSLAPEGANPSGSVNFSKVSHAKLSITVDGFAPSASASTNDDYQVDVYGIYYNWLAIKDGRALTSFA